MIIDRAYVSLCSGHIDLGSILPRFKELRTALSRFGASNLFIIDAYACEQITYTSDLGNTYKHWGYMGAGILPRLVVDADSRMSGCTWEG
jgi:hypothetical protein